MRLEDIYLEAARRFPERLAIVASDGRWTYGAVDLYANRVAHRLQALGVSAGDRVGVWLPKGGRAIAAFQAVLRLGAAYVPLDPSSPWERIQTIVNDGKLSAVVSTRPLAAHLAETEPFPVLELGDRGALANAPAFAPEVRPDAPKDLAYVLYTSGSTGVPKGVCLSHENALAFIQWALDDVEPEPDDRFSSHAPFHFDLSVFDIYVPARRGASLHVISEAASYVPRKLIAFLVENFITVWYSVPSAWVLMLDHGGLEDAGAEAPRVIIFAGEPFPIDHLRRLRALFPTSRLLNYYGPTETNVCTSFEVEDIPQGASDVPIGRAASGNEVWAIKANGQRASVGEEGELLVRGPTVMLGYWGAKPCGEVYPTGDIVRVLSHDSFAYVGRRDGMVKRRGYRVELGEIESVVSSIAGVGRAAAVMTGTGINAELTVYLVGTSQLQPSRIQLKRLIAQSLPRYMVPDRISWVDELPLTPNGKVDRRALAKPGLAS